MITSVTSCPDHRLAEKLKQQQMLGDITPFESTLQGVRSVAIFTSAEATARSASQRILEAAQGTKQLETRFVACRNHGSKSAEKMGNLNSKETVATKEISLFPSFPSVQFLKNRILRGGISSTEFQSNDQRFEALTAKLAQLNDSRSEIG